MSALDSISLASAIANQIDKSGEYFRVVYPIPSPAPETLTATIVPVGGKMATYCDTEHTFAIVLLAPATDFDASIRWLLSGVDEVISSLADDPSCGGKVSGVSVKEWGDVYVTNAQGGDALALRITLNPAELG